jgi:hypothetical protein
MRSEKKWFALRAGQTTLAGTLFWPTATADCPAVVILAGSDRSKRGPLRTSIAKHLAAHNVAALVYDSPGTGASTGNAVLQTRREKRAIEALAAVEDEINAEFLNGVMKIVIPKCEEVKPKHIKIKAH